MITWELIYSGYKHTLHLFSPNSMFFFQSTFLFTSLFLRKMFPDYIQNRLLFRFRIYRSVYFLEQGSGKSVKKEVYCPAQASPLGQELE